MQGGLPFYGPLSEKLEGLIQQHKDNWQSLYDDLFTLRETALAGRRTEASGDDPKIAPFTDLIKQISFGKSAISAQQQATVSDLGIELHRTLQVHLARVGWEMPAEQKKLRSELTDLFINTGDDQLIAACAQLAAEVMQLASHRRHDLLS